MVVEQERECMLIIAGADLMETYCNKGGERVEQTCIGRS